jgi:DNA-binding transcriptional ArsR family regulator
MKKTESVPVDALERIFHEPHRLAILSALCAADEPLSFTELRELCSLTDGNLNRHLNALEEEDVIRVKKAFVDRKPRTTISISSRGLDRFQQYLGALGVALKQARQSIPSGQRAAVFGKKATA